MKTGNFGVMVSNIYMSFPVQIIQRSFAEKQLEYDVILSRVVFNRMFVTGVQVIHIWVKHL